MYRHLTLLLCLSACHPQTTAKDVVIDFTIDAGPKADPNIANACKSLRALDCVEGFPLKEGGMQCEDYLPGVQDFIDVTCVRQATTIHAMHDCNVRCEQRGNP